LAKFFGSSTFAPLPTNGTKTTPSFLGIVDLISLRQISSGFWVGCFKLHDLNDFQKFPGGKNIFNMFTKKPPFVHSSTNRQEPVFLLHHGATPLFCVRYQQFLFRFYWYLPTVSLRTLPAAPF